MWPDLFLGTLLVTFVVLFTPTSGKCLVEILGKKQTSASFLTFILLYSLKVSSYLTTLNARFTNAVKSHICN